MSTSHEYPRASGCGQLIRNLPPELFVQVLDWVYRLLRTIGIPWDTNWTVPYQLVSRRWRDVICSTPQFWQEICIKASPQWLNFCLKRCAGAPAMVDVFRANRSEAIFATLARHAPVIRGFRAHYNVARLYDLKGLPSLLATPMPALEVLLLHGPVYESEILDVPLTHDLVPRLTSLELWNCIAPRDIAVYAPLHHLAFRFGTKWTGSYGKFLDVLCECQALEYLRLDEELLDPFAEELATGARCRTMSPGLTLPHLKTVELSGQREALFHLLATIHMPQATSIELTNCLDDGEPGLVISRLLAPNPQLRIPFLSSLHTVSLSCWHGGPFRVSMYSGPDGKARFSIDYGRAHHELWPGNSLQYLEPNLVAIMDLFSVASVDTLEVQGRLDLVAVETWRRVFLTFSGLRTLHIKGRGTLDSLWLGLSRATAASLEHDGQVCCPSLSEIYVGESEGVASRLKFTATVPLLEIVRRVLSARPLAGCMRVKKLQLYLEYTDELWDQTRELRKGFVEDVEALVEELDYRDGRA